MQITRKISVSVFTESFGHFTHCFSFIFIPSAVERMLLNKQNENGLEATHCCAASYCPAAITSQALQMPMFVQFALPSVALAAAAPAPADRPTGRARVKFRTVTAVVALLEFQCRNYEPLDIRNTIQRAIVYSSNTKGTKGTKLQTGPAEILASLYCYYRQFFAVTS